MDSIEYKIQAKRNELRELLAYALNQPQVYLPVVRQLKEEIKVCDRALIKLRTTKPALRLVN